MMFRTKKLDLYELNIEEIVYWKKTINEETKEEVFRKHKSNSYTLFLDKLGNPKDMPDTSPNESYYIDMITGRIFSILESENYIIIEPSNIRIPKNNFTKQKDTLEKIRKVIETEEISYIGISEDIIFNSYFCDNIFLTEGLDEIPSKKIEDKILETRKSYLERQSYDEKFSEPEFSSYDFMCLFCALNASQRNYSFNRETLIKFIKSCKENNTFSRLLNNIKLKNNGIFSYSDELDEAIAKLKWSRILYTISPETDASIHIFQDIPMSEFIKKRISYFDEMINFIEEYQNYEFEAMHSAYSQIYDEERRDIDNMISGLNDSERIAELLESFEYNSGKTDEVLAKYRNFQESKNVDRAISDSNDTEAKVLKK